MRTWTMCAMGLCVMALVSGCKNAKKEACGHLLIEVTEAHTQVAKVRSDKDSKLSDIGAKLKKEAKLLREEQIKDKKLNELKDDYADNLKAIGDAYDKMGAKTIDFEGFLRETSKASKEETEIQTEIVKYCKGVE
ncbi:MAG: hypothetical protein IPK71_25280 [Myxococcales bacterium]|nr:hypothetical protein [Myxococcales bacterium]MBL9112985.1 hypothetical protein [Myxococcales bacterium]